jgi:SulP family sulfate permease
MFALREAAQAGLFRRESLLPDLLAGLVVGCVALPLAMAFAIASGVKPEQGIYTAIIAGAIVAMFGGSRVQIAGPTGAFVVILADIVAKHGVLGLQVATLLAGGILISLGVARLGGIISFIPAPVITGFTTGIGTIIWIGQWKDFFGLPAPSGERLYEKLWSLLQGFPHLHTATTELATASLLAIVLTPYVPGLRRIPGPLIALLGATAAQAAFHFDGVATVGSAFGGIPHGVPTFKPPGVSFSFVLSMLEPAFTIAMLGAIESLLSATVADGMAGTKHDPNQELIGQGIANVVAPLFGGFAATGAIARTATNIRNGGTTPLAGITHAAVLALIIAFLAPLAANVPLCALSAILFVVAYNMSELRHFTRMVLRAPRADVAILLTTFALTIFTDLVVAVNIGVILALLQFMRRMAASVKVQPLSEHDVMAIGRVKIPRDVLVYEIDGPFFFGAVENFERAIAQTHTDPRLLAILLKRVPFMDISGIQTLEEVIGKLRKRGIEVALCEANPRVKKKLERAGIIALVGEDRYFDALSEALASYAALEEADSTKVL